MTVTAVWHIMFIDRASVTVYDESRVRAIVNGEYDPRSFAPGTVCRVTRSVNSWSGEWSTNDRRIETIETVDVPLTHFA